MALPVVVSPAAGRARYGVAKPSQKRNEKDSPLRCIGMCLPVDQVAAGSMGTMEKGKGEERSKAAKSQIVSGKGPSWVKLLPLTAPHIECRP